MRGSHIVQMPDFSKLDIPEKQRSIRVKDDQIFYELKMQLRKIEDWDGGACKDDYVLIDFVHPDGRSYTRHIEIGGKAFSDLAGILLDRRAGETVYSKINNQDTALHIRTVRRIVNPVFADETIASLCIPGVSTLAEYRTKYLEEHGEEIANRIFRALQPKLIDNLLSLTAFSLDTDELNTYHQRQCTMLQNISGDMEARLLKAYGEDGARTLDECYQRYYEDNKRNFSVQLWAKTLAAQENVVPTDEEYRKAREFYCMVFNTTEDEVEQQNLREEVLRSFYMQYGIGKLREYYKSIVKFSAIGVENLPLNG